MHIYFLSSYLSMRYKCYCRYFMQIFTNSVESLNRQVYSAPPCKFFTYVATESPLFLNPTARGCVYHDSHCDIQANSAFGGHLRRSKA